MKGRTTAEKIVLALTLTPMTVAQLADCLDQPKCSIYKPIKALEETGRVRIVGRVENGKGRPDQLWSAGHDERQFLQPQKAAGQGQGEVKF